MVYTGYSRRTTSRVGILLEINLLTYMFLLQTSEAISDSRDKYDDLRNRRLRNNHNSHAKSLIQNRAAIPLTRTIFLTTWTKYTLSKQ